MEAFDEHRIDHDRRRGRAASTNLTGRFEATQRVAADDGWGVMPDLPPIRTEVRVEVPRTIIARNTSPDIPFDRSINPYRGCEHGCIYCFARPTHAYLNLSPGLDFETRLIARPGAPEALEKELRAKAYKVAPIAMGTNTDPYQPIEREHQIMRGILDVLTRFNHPLTIVTKGTLIERDIDLLAPLAAKGLVHVGVSVTTLDPDLARKMEPRVPQPLRRIEVIRRLAAAGIPTRVMIAPLIPGLTDHEGEAILKAAVEAGAKAASWIALRLPREVAPLWRDWLAEHYPARFNRVMDKVREMHGGADYSPEWGKRMRGEGTYAEFLTQRMRIAIRRFGLDGKLPPLRTDLFAVPPRPGDQLSLF